ncbi:helix-turn-helix domain-containing protein [Vibrio crassostreae]|uniref:helix-turn-helix domain-containing protein n=1 Tax=Vibrio crassostreae TaxID=246167 RepID=UPI001052A3A4|nr:helix-turn-helix domain-containing protein [Vibrio crassostreae]
MNNHPSPIDKNFLKQLVRSKLEPTWSDSKSSTPDMSWITPVVLDVLYSELMIHTRGNQTKAAKILGINRGNFSAKLKQKSRQSFTLDTVNDRV